MSKKIINSIQIQVTTQFRDDVSNIDASSYLYYYQIRIQNLGENPYFLLSTNFHAKCVKYELNSCVLYNKTQNSAQFV